MNQRAQIYTVIGCILGVVVVFWMGYGMAISINGSKGFRLPDGDYDAGMKAFIELGCSNCHSVFEEADFARPSEYEDLLVPLGGKVHVVRAYGDLVTAIIHPSESIRPDIQKRYVDVEGRSMMPDLTTQMTTRQMIDIVTYLHPHYEVVLPDYPINYYPYNGVLP